MKSARLWFVLLTGGGVLYFVVADMSRTSPGPLSAVHQRESKLSGLGSCSQCHGGWFGEMTEACLECHEPIAAQLDSGAGLHGAVAKEHGRHCAPCHSEHHGEGFDVVNRQSFIQAGVPDPEKFDHNLVGYAMEGKHLELECEKCHENAKVDVLPAGETRFLGLARDCAECHEDPHKGKMSVACAECHTERSFEEHFSRGHEEHLHLLGGHADVGCRDCHAPDTVHALEEIGTGLGTAARACADCHESPHSPEFVAGIGIVAKRKIGATCLACHQAEHTGFADERLTVTPEHHAQSGFALTEPHHEVACEKCHAPGAEFAARYPGRDANHCATCHDDPHGGQFGAGPFGANGCLECHDRKRFEPPAFDVEKHVGTSMALTGRHVETECRACHKVPAENQPRVFRGTEGRCASCHGDAHRGFFAPHVEVLEKTERGTCAACHTTEAFSTSGGDADFDHAQWTGFAIVGAHAQSACEACHPRGAEADSQGRTFGRVADHFGEYKGCATCHENPHGDDFDGKARPKEVEGRTGCARCHSQTSFRSFPEEFDHGLWTGFRLRGAHAEANCSACHTPLRKPDASGRTWKRARGAACADCHDDAHAGQFARRGRTDCAKCHRSALSFSQLRFNHDTHTKFRLGDAHERVACDACHKPVRVGGREVKKYRPMRSRCVDCHASQKKRYRRETR
jgi:hypothetical protein